MRIVFMGTPDFAVPCLEAVINAGHQVVGVFSQPDKPVGRKQIVMPTPVKECAQKYNIPVYQPNSLRSDEQLQLMKELNPQAVAVVAYGKLIPADMLKVAPLGYVNVHGSILPKYRGAAPIQWSVVNGDKVTGVTTMLLGEGMDTGDILEVSTTEIGENETAGELFDRLSVMGAELLVSTLSKLEKEALTPIKQNEDEATLAPIINKEMALIDFNKSADEIHNLIRGFNPWPIAYTTLDGKRFKIYETKVADFTSIKVGFVKICNNRLFVGCGNNTSLELMQGQQEGSRRMTAKELLCGRSITENTVFG